MKNYTYHFEVEDILQQFAAALNDISIKRYNKEREAKDQIHANFLYAPKTRTLHELVNKAQHVKLPCISISIGGIKRDVNRVFNKLEGTWWTNSGTVHPSDVKWVNLLQPVPVDITVNVSILSRFQQDVDQILTNFIPYTDPYFIISWKWPDEITMSDFEIRSQVNWNENISYEYPMDISKEKAYWTNANTSFTIKSWMFKNMEPDGKPIYTIDCSFTSVSAIDSYPLMKTLEDTYNTDVFIISARPQCENIYPYYTYIGTAALTGEKNFKVNGKMMDYVNSVYLSANDWTIFDYTSSGEFVTSPSTIDLFSVSSFAASASYPAFMGIELLSANWTIIDQNYLDFTFTPQQTGVFDVVMVNEAGYGILSNDSIRPTLNPYREGTDDYNNYIEWQYPCISGIEIKHV